MSLGLGYVPAGYDKWADLWSAPLPDYDLPILHNSPISYIISGSLGTVLTVVLIAAFAYLIHKTGNIFRQKKHPAR